MQVQEEQRGSIWTQPLSPTFQDQELTSNSLSSLFSQLVDYDRHNNAFTKVKEKKEKTLKDEQNLFKLEQDFETAAADYEYYNNALKEELPQLFEMSSRFISPLWQSFYYMQLNVFYLSLDKLQTFTQGKYDISQQAGSVEDIYAQQLTDAAEQMEALTIRKGPMPSGE